MKGADWVLATTPLAPSDAAAAIIVVDGSGYLLQLRDSLPHIWFPGHWGTFGGAIDPGEDAIGALRRELREELALSFDEARHVSSLDFAIPRVTDRKFARHYYEIRISAAAAANVTLGEGADLGVFPADKVFGELRLAPYDGFALFLHFAERRIRG